jgi:hypothetical protein
MLTEALIGLASAGGVTLVQAASTDAWHAAKAGFARLLARGDDQRVRVIEGRLETTYAELQPLAGHDLERARRAQETAWSTRFQDLLEEHPDAAAELQALLGDLGGGSSVEASAGHHGVAVGGDLSMEATSGGVSAAVIHGGVSTSGNPPLPGADLA